jgi:hypothetical protein
MSAIRGSMRQPMRLSLRTPFIRGLAATVQYPLDNLDAAAAYSLRKLRGAYTGPLMRVRRSSDNAEQDISALSVADVNGNKLLDEQALKEHVGYQNLLRHSAAFENAVWAAQPNSAETIGVNAAFAPDGSIAAQSVTVASASSSSAQSVAGGLPAGTTVTASIHVKRGTSGDWMRLAVFSLGNASSQFRVWFNMATGAFGTTNAIGNAVFDSASVTALDDGWYRISITGSLTVDTDYVLLAVAANANNVTTRTVGLNRLMWGAQLNLGAEQPYQQTVATENQGNGFVVTWYDQTGNGRHATQATAGSQPNIMKNGVLNEDADGNEFLDFDSKFMEASAGIGSATSIVAVYSKSVTAVNMHVFGSGKNSGLNGVNIFEDQTGRTNVTKDINRYFNAVDNSLEKKILVGENTPTVLYYKNGVAAPLDVPVTTSVESSRVSVGTSSFPLQGKFYGGMIFQNQLSTEDRQLLERNFGAYYGITVA